MIEPPHAFIRYILQRGAEAQAAKGWRKEQDDAHRTYTDILKRIAIAQETGENTRNLTRLFLRDRKVRLSAALRVMGFNPDRQATYALRDLVNPWANDLPPIAWYWKRKSSGGARPICKLSDAVKATHAMLASLIKSHLRPGPMLFGVTGKGSADAAIALKAAQIAGYVHLAKVDVRDCFQSFNPEAIYSLKYLPKEVTHRTLDTRNLRFAYGGKAGQRPCCTPMHSLDHHNASGPRGLIQGSPASSAILATLLNTVPLSGDVKVFICFDNIAVAAKDPAGSRATVKLLGDFLNRLSAGPLALCDAEYADNAPMEFLGYLFDPSRTDIGLADRAFVKLAESLVLAEGADIAAGKEFPLHVWKAFRDFRNGYAAVDDMYAELEVFIEHSSYLADRTDLARSFHANLFQPSGTEIGDYLNTLTAQVKTIKRGKNDWRPAA